MPQIYKYVLPQSGSDKTHIFIFAAFGRLQAAPSELTGRTPFQLTECLGKITHLLEPALRANVRNLPIGRCQQSRRLLDAHLSEILDRRAADHTPKASQALVLAEVDAPRDLSKGQLIAGVFLDVVQHDLDPLSIPQSFL